MSRLEIKHFLVTYDPENDQTKAEDFGTDYDRALAAYAQAERVAGFATKLDSRRNLVQLRTERAPNLRRSRELRAPCRA